MKLMYVNSKLKLFRNSDWRFRIFLPNAMKVATSEIRNPKSEIRNPKSI
jgi:hypothetical protein